MEKSYDNRSCLDNSPQHHNDDSSDDEDSRMYQLMYGYTEEPIDSSDPVLEQLEQRQFYQPDDYDDDNEHRDPPSSENSEISSSHGDDEKVFDQIEQCDDENSFVNSNNIIDGDDQSSAAEQKGKVKNQSNQGDTTTHGGSALYSSDIISHSASTQSPKPIPMSPRTSNATPPHSSHNTPHSTSHRQSEDADDNDNDDNDNDDNVDVDDNDNDGDVCGQARDSPMTHDIIKQQQPVQQLSPTSPSQRSPPCTNQHQLPLISPSSPTPFNHHYPYHADTISASSPAPPHLHPPYLHHPIHPGQLSRHPEHPTAQPPPLPSRSVPTTTSTYLTQDSPIVQSFLTVTSRHPKAPSLQDLPSDDLMLLHSINAHYLIQLTKRGKDGVIATQTKQDDVTPHPPPPPPNDLGAFHAESML